MNLEKMVLNVTKFPATLRFKIGSFENIRFSCDIPPELSETNLDIVATGILDFNGQSFPNPSDPETHPASDLFWTTASFENKKVKIIATLKDRVDVERDYVVSLTIVVLYR